MYVRALASPPPAGARPSVPAPTWHDLRDGCRAGGGDRQGSSRCFGGSAAVARGDRRGDFVRGRRDGSARLATSLLLLLAGVGLGAAYGYSGTVLVVEGSSFTNSLINYDQFTSGPLVDLGGGLPPFSLKLTSFDASYQPDGPHGRSWRTSPPARIRPVPRPPAEIAVNAPWRDGSAKVYLIGHGYSPHFTVRDASGRVWFDQYVPCTPRDQNFTSTCTVKVPDTGQPRRGPNKRPLQLAFTVGLLPDDPARPARGLRIRLPGAAGTGVDGASSGRRPAPCQRGATLWLDALDESAMRQVPVTGPAGTRRPAQVLAPGNPKQRTLTGLPGGMTLTVDDVRQFATFQIKSDPYKGLVLVAAVLLLVGLVTSLRVRRRRIWLRAGPRLGRPYARRGRRAVPVGGGPVCRRIQRCRARARAKMT